MHKFLLASHGSVGALSAEQAAFNRLEPGDKLYHLIVVPDFWEGMQGDDWLNNASTRDVYADYVETTLENEVLIEINRVKALAKKHNIEFEYRVVYGDPAQCLLYAINDVCPTLVITGVPRPKNKPGQHSKMITIDVLRKLPVPLLMIP